MDDTTDPTITNHGINRDATRLKLLAHGLDHGAPHRSMDPPMEYFNISMEHPIVPWTLLWNISLFMLQHPVTYINPRCTMNYAMGYPWCCTTPERTFRPRVNSQF